MSERNRLYWQCRRGMLELDLMLIPFLDGAYQQLDSDEQENFQTLLTMTDPEIYAWLMGQMLPSDSKLSSIVVKIREYANKSNKTKD